MHRDCFALLPNDLMARCVDVVKASNDAAMLNMARAVLRDEIEALHSRCTRELATTAEREAVLLGQIRALGPLLELAVKSCVEQQRSTREC